VHFGEMVRPSSVPLYGGPPSPRGKACCAKQSFNFLFRFGKRGIGKIHIEFLEKKLEIGIGVN